MRRIRRELVAIDRVYFLQWLISHMSIITLSWSSIGAGVSKVPQDSCPSPSLLPLLRTAHRGTKRRLRSLTLLLCSCKKHLLPQPSPTLGWRLMRAHSLRQILVLQRHATGLPLMLIGNERRCSGGGAERWRKKSRRCLFLLVQLCLASAFPATGVRLRATWLGGPRRLAVFAVEGSS